ncbi:MAG: phosphatase domain-containing protein [Planctomycetota bacterium]
MGQGSPAPERNGHRYPLVRTNDRKLADYSGASYLWDIDNTYLMTEWSSIRDLLRIRFEGALDKRPVAGAPELLQALRRGATASGERRPIYFVSASPETMRPVLEKRMLLDGVEQDGATFRDLWTGALQMPHLRHIRDVYGYKIAALLLYRLESSPRARETLFGDDREHDPEVYVLYARVCGGAMRGKQLEEVLAARNVRRPDIAYISTLASELPEHDPVERIVIRRIKPVERAPGDEPGEAAKTSPFDAQDNRVHLVSDYAESAAILFGAGLMDARGFARVYTAVRGESGRDVEKLLRTAKPDLAPEALAAVSAEFGRLPTPLPEAKEAQET